MAVVALATLAAVAAGAVQVLTFEEVSAGGLQARWQSLFTDELDNATFDLVNGPLWRLKLLKSTDEAKSALVFTFNHALDDQGSLNMLVDEIMQRMGELATEGKVE